MDVKGPMSLYGNHKAALHLNTGAEHSQLFSVSIPVKHITKYIRNRLWSNVFQLTKGKIYGNVIFHLSDKSFSVFPSFANNFD